MSFTRRTSTTSPNDMASNAYYNERTYSGTHSYNEYYGTNYQCTYYALARTCEIAGGKVTYFTALGETAADCIDSTPIFTRQGFGNGGEWFSDANWETTTDVSKVEPGDIVCYGSSYGGGYGHVAIIEAVTDTTLTLSEANWTYANKCDFDRTITKVNGGGASAGGIQGYIINPFKGSEPTGQYEFTYGVDPEGSGYITGDPEGYYDEGTVVSVTAHANSGYKFKIWNNGDTTETMTTTMTRDKHRIAYFEKGDDAEFIACQMAIKRKGGKINEITILV